MPKVICDMMIQVLALSPCFTHLCSSVISKFNRQQCSAIFVLVVSILKFSALFGRAEIPAVSRVSPIIKKKKKKK